MKGISQTPIANYVKKTQLQKHFVEVKNTRKGPRNAAFTASIPQCTGSPIQNDESSR